MAAAQFNYPIVPVPDALVADGRVSPGSVGVWARMANDADLRKVGHGDLSWRHYVAELERYGYVIREPDAPLYAMTIPGGGYTKPSA